MKKINKLIAIIVIMFLLVTILIHNKHFLKKEKFEIAIPQKSLCLNYQEKYNENISQKILVESQKYLNIPYLLGSKYKDVNAKNPKDKYEAIDCSDFVEAVLEKVLATDFASTSAELAYQLKNNCVSYENIKPGDIIFWQDINNERVFKRYSQIFHVAIYVGHNRVIEATQNEKYNIKEVVYSDLFRNRGGTLVMIARAY